jgi:putative Mn2+ efflux pump MntP
MVIIILISLGLALDSFSVSIAGGIKSQKARTTDAIKVSAFFGSFQALMPVIGWLIAEASKNFISAIDHWIAFILLVAIGIKMIVESFSSNNDNKKDLLETKTLLLLAIATSIDALVVGITLNLLKTPFLISISTIGLVTFALSFLGFLFGKRLGKLFGKRIEILGGLVLILIGIKILIEHLM